MTAHSNGLADDRKSISVPVFLVTFAYWATEGSFGKLSFRYISFSQGDVGVSNGKPINSEFEAIRFD
ncbi:hypothetical protein CEXT_158661 [Caerostris extrusa]|uniref:Uncharacterized protein n=1 Tax=Caerostris extrusa TaxID=172846 RepID=A0AAV4UKH1_CAEEX|nr:hypothetical protein CEXT_158661 [Caerostris extrusa]